MQGSIRYLFWTSGAVNRESVGTAELAYYLFVRNPIMLGQPVVGELSTYLQMDSTHSATFFFEV